MPSSAILAKIVILIFFGLPIIPNFIDNNFKTNSEVSNISKKNFEITFNNKKNKLKNSGIRIRANGIKILKFSSLGPRGAHNIFFLVNKKEWKFMSKSS